MEENKRSLHNKPYVEPVYYFEQQMNCYDIEKRSYTNNHNVSPMNILPSLDQSLNNSHKLENKFKRIDNDSLKHLVTSPAAASKTNKNLPSAKLDGGGDNKNNNKKKNMVHKKNGVPFYVRSTAYNKYNYNFFNSNKHYCNNVNRQCSESKYSGISPELQRKVCGLMERFTSKAKLFKIVRNPSLFHNCDCAELNQSIWDLYCLRVEKMEKYLEKLKFWKMMYLGLNGISFKYGLFMVGSTMCGFATENSDIDMCLLVKPCLNDARSDALSYLHIVQMVLQQSDFVKSSELILAKVPILKLVSSEHGFEVDLNCNNAVGIRNTHLMSCYAQSDWRVRPLVILVKLWARANNINDAKNKTISSYSLVLMVLHYLQCGVNPPVVPCLHQRFPHKFNPYSEVHTMDVQEELLQDQSNNKQCLGELFRGFLRYYSFFNFNEWAISVRQGSVLSKEECRYNRSPKNTMTQWKLLCIEEPFDFTNTAKSVYDIEAFEHIKYVFYMSYVLLNDTKTLSAIFPVQSYRNPGIPKTVTGRDCET